MTARGIQNDEPWLNAMSDQRVILEDGAAIFGNMGLVSDTNVRESGGASDANASASTGHDDALDVAKKLLSAPCAASDNLDQLFKFRRACLQSNGCAKPRSGFSTVCVLTGATGLQKWKADLSSKRAPMQASSAATPPKAFSRTFGFPCLF